MLRIRALSISLAAALAAPLALGLCAQPAAAFDDLPGPGALLSDLSTASARLNYVGVVLYQRGNDLQTLRVVHRGRPGPEAERIMTLDGPAREVVRDGASVRCIFADDAQANLAQSAPANPLRLSGDLDMASIDAMYAIETLGESRLAGRDTFVVAITPTETTRYGYQLWIDQETRFLLMSEVLDATGAVMERTRFSEIRFPSEITDADLAPRLRERVALRSSASQTQEAGMDASATDLASAAVGAGRTDAAAVATSEPDWQVGWLPPGFTMRESSVADLGVAPMPVSHQVYGDGLAMVSVFVERIGPVATDGPDIGFASVGAMNAVSRVEEGHKVTVVGELPRQAITRIAASVHRIH